MPISGMILMPAGIPFINTINGSDKHVITVACVHTVESLQQYPCGCEVHGLADVVVKIAFGRPAINEKLFQQLLLSNKGVSREALEGDELLQATWLAENGIAEPEELVFLDEAGVDDYIGERTQD